MRRITLPIAGIFALMSLAQCTRKSNEEGKEKSKNSSTKKAGKPKKNHPMSSKRRPEMSNKKKGPKGAMKKVEPETPKEKPGHALFMKYLAYKNGDRVKQSVRKSLKFLKKACEAGHFDACFKRAVMMNGGDIDEDKGFNHHKELKRLCDNKHAHACSLLGYLIGEKAKNYRKKKKQKLLADSHRLYIRACDLKHFFTCVDVSENIRKGRGVKKDPAKAAVFEERGFKGLVEACGKGRLSACDNVIARYKGPTYGFCSPPWSSCKKDLKKLKPLVEMVIKKVRLSCEKNDVEACAYLPTIIGKFKFLKNQRARKKKAMMAYEKALTDSCKKKHGTHCFQLAERHKRIHRDLDKALEAYKAACDQGVSKGCYYKNRGADAM